MGRFERGLAKIPPREPADAASPSPDIAASAPEDDTGEWVTLGYLTDLTLDEVVAMAGSWAP
jgi:hypothetical protein